MTTPHTTASAHPRRLGRSTAAVLLGFVAVAVLSLGTDEVLHVLRVFPPWGEPTGNALLVLATAYRVVYTIAGGYVTARFAPNRPLAHALALGVLGLVAGLAGAVATWNRGPAFDPHWYPVTLVLTAVPCAWLGGAGYRGKRP